MATPESSELLSLAIELVRRAADLVGESRAAAVTSMDEAGPLVRSSYHAHEHVR